MNIRERLHKIFDQPGLLAVDVGGGTQDILLWKPGGPPENACKMVMPSPTVLVAREIERYTERGEPVCLTGVTMGGGACGVAARRHMERGLDLYALPVAAMTFHDNLDYVRQMGVKIVNEPPPDARVVVMGDLDLERIGGAFARFGVELPGDVAVALQDHGFSPDQSNRIARFRYWRGLLDSGSSVRGWVNADPPATMNRMQAVRGVCPGSLVLDTGLAAILGAMLDPAAARWAKKGYTVVNAGNFHTVAALVKGERIHGIYEHHTECLDVETFAGHLADFQTGRLSHEQVFDSEGHGCAYSADFPEGDFGRVVITGPQRRSLSLPGFHEAAPFGDMMLSGCFGLLLAMYWLREA